MEEEVLIVIISVAVVLIGLFFISGLKLAYEYERIVVFRLGKYVRTIGPGLVYVIPILEKGVKVDLRIITQDIPRQEVMTKDNIPVLTNAVVYFKVERPEDAVIKIANYRYAVQQYTQAALRDTIGTMELDQVLTERDQIAADIKKIVDKETSEWGVDIEAIKMQEIELPAEMKRAFAIQAEAERDKRAVIIKAEGEFIAAKKLRTLQTIRDIAQDPSEKVVIFMPGGLTEEITDIIHKVNKSKE
ncbi:MAG: SPFH domain-containing protein [Candidatus Heimdallarchaeaceae archaeon]